MKEVWKEIEGYENYLVSSNGRIAKILKGDGNGKGYRYLKFKDNKRFYIHQLVAKMFIPNPRKFPIINHKNGDKNNNNVNNLEWCSYSHNIKEAYRLGLNYSNSKKINQYSLDDKFIKQWKSMSEIQRKLGINYSGISKCCRNIRKTFKGYKWQYANEGDE